MKIFRNMLDPLFGSGLTAFFFADEAEEETGGGTATEEETKQEISEDLQQDMEDFDKKIDETPDDKEEEEDDEDIELESEEDAADEEEDSEAEDDDSSDEEDDDDKDTVIDDELLARAEKLGLDADEAKAFKNPETLKRILDSLSPDKQEEQTKENPYKLELEFDDSFDPDFVAQVNKLNDHYAGIIDKMDQRMNAMMDAQYTDKFDGVVNSLGDGWETVFGKGGQVELSRSSKEFKNRQRLAEEVDIIQQGRVRLGKQPLPMREAMEKALHGEFRKEFQKINDGEHKKTAQKKRRQTLSRGSRFTKKKPLSGLDEALEISRDFDRRVDEEGY